LRDMEKLSTQVRQAIAELYDSHAGGERLAQTSAKERPDTLLRPEA